MTEIYLDSAATSLHKPPQVAQAVAEAICKAGNAARRAHGASLSALRTVYDTRCLAARLLGCPRPDHVVFAANSTMALNIAICGLLSPGDHAPVCPAAAGNGPELCPGGQKRAGFL